MIRLPLPSLFCLLLGIGLLLPVHTAETDRPTQGTSAQSCNAQAIAEARIGRWGRALAEFRRAESLAPGNADVQENLRLAQARLDLTPTPNPLRLLAVVPINGWAGAALFAVWSTATLAALRRLRPDWRAPLAGPLWGTAIASAVALTLMGLALVGRRLTPNAVVIGRDAVLRQGPVDAAKPLGTIPEGSELRIRRIHQGWVELTRVPPGSPVLGWLPPGQVVLLDR